MNRTIAMSLACMICCISASTITPAAVARTNIQLASIQEPVGAPTLMQEQTAKKPDQIKAGFKKVIVLTKDSVSVKYVPIK